MYGSCLSARVFDLSYIDKRSYEIQMCLQRALKKCNMIGVFPGRFFSFWHAQPMLLVLTQSQIKIMKIPVNGTPEFARFFQSLNKTEQIFKEIDAVLETLAENPKLGELVRFELIPKPLHRKNTQILTTC